MESIVDRMSEPTALEELVRSLEIARQIPSADLLAGVVSELRPSALGPLLSLSLRCSEPVAGLLESSLVGMAGRNPDALVRLLGAEEPELLAGAARLAGRLRTVEAREAIGPLLERREPEVRVAALEALRSLGGDADTVAAIGPLLEDEHAEVRVAAARALGATGEPSAARWFEARILDRALRNVDLSEKIAVFEGYGRVGERDALGLLDRFLNGRGFLGRREGSELRGSAALALGRMGGSRARLTLERAREDADPVVRSAVRRALQLLTTEEA